MAVCPPSLDPVGRGSYEYQALRPSLLPLPEPVALPVSFANPDRPLIYLTLGTFSNNALDLFRLVLRALEDEPVNVIATVGRDNDPLALGPTPENAHVEQFIDQAQQFAGGDGCGWCFPTAPRWFTTREPGPCSVF